MKAPRIAGHYNRLAEHGRAAAWSLEDYLAAVLAVESNARAESGARQRIRYAGFPAIKTITDFDFTSQPALEGARSPASKAVAVSPKPATSSCLDRPAPTTPPSTGKAHLATALAIAAAQAGHRVAFAPATGWISRLAEAHSIGRLEAELRKISRYGLIVIDEVGYIPFDTEAANLFFQLVSTRHEKSSIILTSSLPFSRWGQVFGEATIASAMIARIVYDSDVIALKGVGYRIEHTTIETLPSVELDRRQTQPRKHTCSLFDRNRLLTIQPELTVFRHAALGTAFGYVRNSA